jgi:hypothetical protein
LPVLDVFPVLVGFALVGVALVGIALVMSAMVRPENWRICQPEAIA